MDRRGHTDPDLARPVRADAAAHLPPRPLADRSATERITAWLTWFGPGRLVATVGGVAAVALGGFWLVRAPAPPAEATLPSAVPSSPVATLAPPTTGLPADDGRQSAPSEPAVVHVAGAVRSPGVYHLTGARRVHEAIELAGGAAADADLDAVNLAQPLFDGQRLYVPAIGESVEAAIVTPVVGTSGGENDSPPALPSGPIDLNRATHSELEMLPGVGPSTAQAIIDDRERNGPFATVDELDRVPGVGPAKLASLRDLVTV